MSLTEEARAPFSLVDEINQVCCFPRYLGCLLITSAGHGPARRAHGAQLDGGGYVQTGERTVLPHHAQVAARPHVPRAYEDPLRQQRRVAALGHFGRWQHERHDHKVLAPPQQDCECCVDVVLVESSIGGPALDLLSLFVSLDFVLAYHSLSLLLKVT